MLILMFYRPLKYVAFFHCLYLFFITRLYLFEKSVTQNRRFSLNGLKVFTFLQGSIIAGLVNRVVFIWPSWDKANKSHPYEAVTYQLGWFPPEKASGKTKEFCICKVCQTVVQSIYDWHFFRLWEN